jgi:hypothetical protein
VTWFKVQRGTLAYAGRITREPFTRWAATARGRDAVAAVARTIRFSLFGRARSARRRLWRALEAASRTASVTTAVTAEAGRYMQVLAGVAYADSLPRTHIALRRLVLVPRAMITGRAQAAVFGRLNQAPELAGVDEAVRGFFLERLVIEMDAALQKSSPSPRRPVQAGGEWACVGVSLGTVWVDRLWAGPDGTGHVFMYEIPPAGLPRKERKALEAAIAQMTASVSSLSRAERATLVRSAVLRLS